MNNLEIPIVYVGDKPKDEPKVLGCQLHFTRGIPKRVGLRFANLLLNSASYVNASDADWRLANGPTIDVRNILVARTIHSIGDMLMATLTPKALKRKYPQARVHVAVPRESFPIWFHHPWVDSLIPWGEPEGEANVSALQCDLYFNITRPCVQYEQAHWPSRKQRIDIYMEHCGAQLPDDEKQPIYHVTDQEREWARQETGGRFFFGIQLRANHPMRNWQANCAQDRNAEIIRRWLEAHPDLDVLVFDQHKDLLDKLPQGKRVWTRPGLALRQVFALQERCVGMLTLDSGLLHASGALGIPVVALFGNIHPESRTTYYQNVVALFRPEACPQRIAPCNSVCGRQYCLEAITADEAWQAIERNHETAGRRRLDFMKEIDDPCRDSTLSLSE